MCTSFEPALMKFVSAAETSGKPVELVYVASDRSKGDAMARAKALGCLQVSFDGDVRSNLKKQFNVWSGSEIMEFGPFGRRSGVPALVVLSEDANSQVRTFMASAPPRRVIAHRITHRDLHIEASMAPATRTRLPKPMAAAMAVAVAIGVARTGRTHQ